MNKSESDKYWTEIIQTCRVSGLSDYEWCRMNHISTSSFYYNVKRLRMATCNNVVTAVPVHEKQEFVPICYILIKMDLYSIISDLIREDFNGRVTRMR